MSSFLESAIQFLPLTLLLVAAWLLLGRSFLRRRLAGIREKAIYRNEQTWTTYESPRRFALPYVAAFWCVLLVSGVVLGPASSAIDLEEPSKLNAYRFLGMVPFLIAAVVIHLRPNHSRALKYTLLLGPVPWLDLFLSGAVIRDLISVGEFSIQGLISFPLFGPLFFLSVWWFVGFIAISSSLPYLTSAWGTTTQPPNAQMYIFSFLRMRSFTVAILPCLFIAPSIAIIFLSGRYVLGEVFRRHPIVYLRSFRYEGSAAVFGRAVAPGLAPFGVTRALVHETQTGRALLSKTSIWQFGVLATVPDALWQGWVEDAIRDCTLVLIDCSVRTDSVDWEVQAALRETEPARVLLITTGQAADTTISGATVLPYSADRNGINRLRGQVAAWAEKALGMNLRKSRRIAACIWGFLLLLFFGFVLTFTLFQTLPR